MKKLVNVKSRFVGNSSTETGGLDYEETYFSSKKFATIRILMFSCSFRLKIVSNRYTTVFFSFLFFFNYCNLKEEIYVHQPKGIEIKDKAIEN